MNNVLNSFLSRKAVLTPPCTLCVTCENIKITADVARSIVYHLVVYRSRQLMWRLEIRCHCGEKTGHLCYLLIASVGRRAVVDGVDGRLDSTRAYDDRC